MRKMIGKVPTLGIQFPERNCHIPENHSKTCEADEKITPK